MTELLGRVMRIGEPAVEMRFRALLLSRGFPVFRLVVRSWPGSATTEAEWVILFALCGAESALFQVSAGSMVVFRGFEFLRFFRALGRRATTAGGTPALRFV